MLSRDSLKRVLRSLIAFNLNRSRDIRTDQGCFHDGRLTWSDDLKIRSGGSNTLGCDSLEALWLASAVNEMFHLYEASSNAELLAAESFGDWIDIIDAAWRNQVNRVTFTTSGSTGSPKRCTHSFKFLQAEVDYLASLFDSHTRLFAFTPAHHIYGFLFTGMLADKVGCEVVAVRSGNFIEMIRTLRSGDLVVSIPSCWQALDRTIARWPSGVAGIVSTSPCPEGLLTSLVGRGLEQMTEVYGSSETAGVGLRRWPKQAFQLMPQWRRLPSELRDDPGLCHISGKIYRLQDQVVFQANDRFTLEGRLDGAVQVGGVNVYPHRVASLLSSRPGVSQAIVRLMRRGEGFRLKALIVSAPTTDENQLRQELELWMDKNLELEERPRSIILTNALPIMPAGEELDW